MRKLTITFRLYVFCIFLLFLDAMYPWYMWENCVRPLTFVITALVSLFLGFTESGRFFVTRKHLLFTLFLFLSLFWNAIGGDGTLRSFSAKFLIWIYLLSLNSDSKQYVLQFITKWTACLVLVSLICYLLFFLDVLSINPTLISCNNNGYIHWNYYAFTVNAKPVYMHRFMGFFMEPGHVTMGIVPLILANGFDLKNKYVRILFICELFTLSLAGYVTLFVGYLLFHGSVRSLKPILGGIFFVSLLLYFADLAGFSDILDAFIWNRLEYRDGDIAGNNRVTAEFEKAYQSFIRSSEVWTGDIRIDITKYGGISGYKKYLVQNGIIGLSFTLLVYGFNYLMSFKYKVGAFTLILFMLLFQNAYPFWFCMMAMYILGCDNLKNGRAIYA